ncbi:TolC family protein [candidate division KSB1 bacterium]|nr:TolC family protein [candidate division KSB1 bacterium]RQW04370.1 MAG: TolC family protein [candidate division KSB1 bacterium]
MIKNALLIILVLYTLAPAQESLGLNDAIAIALENNYTIRVTKSDQRVAEINNAWGTAGLYPSIDFSLNGSRYWDYSESDNPDAGQMQLGDFERDQLQANVSLNWLLFDGLGIQIRKSKLKLFENLSAGNTAVVIEQTIQDVILAYYAVLLEKEKLQVARTLMQLSKDRYDYQTERQQLGSQTTYDVLQAQNSYLEDKGRFMLQEVAYKNAIRNLNFLMAANAQETWTFADAFVVDPVVYDLEVLKEKMLTNNRTLKNQYISQSLLEKEISLAKSAWSPVLSLRGSYNNNDVELRYQSFDPQQNDSYNYLVSLNLSWSLFNGGNRSRAVQIARIDRETGETQIENIKHTLTNQLYNFYEIHLVRQELLNVADEALETAQLNLSISEDKFRSGAINSFNFRDVQLLYLNSAVNRLDAIYAYLDVDTALLRLTGGIIQQYE